jgi:hypothetical protein
MAGEQHGMCELALILLFTFKKKLEFLLTTGLALTPAICFVMYTTIKLELKLSVFQQFLIKVKNHQIK